MKMFELIPNNGRKSFYGKAKVIDNENGIISLLSYNTVVCSNLQRTVRKAGNNNV